MWTQIKMECGAIFTVWFIYIHTLLIDKDFYECQNVSIRFLCSVLFVSFIQRPLKFFSKSFPIFIFIFVLSILWYFPFPNKQDISVWQKNLSIKRGCEHKHIVKMLPHFQNFPNWQKLLSGQNVWFIMCWRPVGMSYLTWVLVGFIKPGEEQRPLELGVAHHILLDSQSCHLLLQIVTLSTEQFVNIKGKTGKVKW